MPLETVERAGEERTRVEFETPFGIPVDYGQPNFEAPDVAPWVRLTVLGGLDVTIEIDARTRETSGSYEFQIFTKVKRDNARIYDQLADVFRNQEFDGIRTYDPQRIVAGLNNGWWQSNMTVEWEITSDN